MDCLRQNQYTLRMQADKNMYRSRVSSFPNQDTNISTKEIIHYAIWLLVVTSGFLITYTFNDFSMTLKQVNDHVSKLDVSLSVLAQHVADEDAEKALK